MESYSKIIIYGSDILNSSGMNNEKSFIQHGHISCYEHSVNVALMSLSIAKCFSISVNERSLIRGALLHDYFLYDWHKKGHSLHGFFHAEIALKNAERDFCLNEIERDIIRRHMFPLNIRPPKHRESYIVCLADKLCAVYEFFKSVKILKFGGNKI